MTTTTTTHRIHYKAICSRPHCGAVIESSVIPVEGETDAEAVERGLEANHWVNGMCPVCAAADHAEKRGWEDRKEAEEV